MIMYIYIFFILFYFIFIGIISENTPEGRKTTKLDKILLNGNNITMANTLIYPAVHFFLSSFFGSNFFLFFTQKLIPGGEGPETH